MAKKKSIAQKLPASRCTLNERKMAFAGAAVAAIGMLGLGIIAAASMSMVGGIYGRGMMGGYGFAPLRMLFGLVFALLSGFIAGYVLAWTYNRA